MKTASFLAVAFLAPALASAQTGDIGAALLADKAVAGALERLKATEPELIAEQIRVCEIPAPPFAEEARGLEFKNIFTKLDVRSQATLLEKLKPWKQ